MELSKSLSSTKCNNSRNTMCLNKVYNCARPFPNKFPRDCLDITQSHSTCKTSQTTEIYKSSCWNSSTHIEELSLEPNHCTHSPYSTTCPVRHRHWPTASTSNSEKLRHGGTCLRIRRERVSIAAQTPRSPFIYTSPGMHRKSRTRLLLTIPMPMPMTTTAFSKNCCRKVRSTVGAREGMWIFASSVTTRRSPVECASTLRVRALLTISSRTSSK